MLIYNYFLEKFGKLNDSEKRLLHYLESNEFKYENIKNLLQKADLSVSSLYHFLNKNNFKSYKDLYQFVRSIKKEIAHHDIYEKSYIYKKYLQHLNTNYMEWIGGDLISIANLISQHHEILIFSQNKINGQVMQSEMQKYKVNVLFLSDMQKTLWLLNNLKNPLLLIIDFENDQKLHPIINDISNEVSTIYFGPQKFANLLYLKINTNDYPGVSILQSIIFLCDLIQHAQQYLIAFETKKRERNTYDFYQKMINQYFPKLKK